MSGGCRSPPSDLSAGRGVGPSTARRRAGRAWSKSTSDDDRADGHRGAVASEAECSQDQKRDPIAIPTTRPVLDSRKSSTTRSPRPTGCSCAMCRIVKHADARPGAGASETDRAASRSTAHGPDPARLLDHGAGEGPTPHREPGQGGTRHRAGLPGPEGHAQRVRVERRRRVHRERAAPGSRPDRAPPSRPEPAHRDPRRRSRAVARSPPGRRQEPLRVLEGGQHPHAR